MNEVDVTLGGPKLYVERSPHWAALEKAHLLKQPDCQVCGTRIGCQVHHIKPYHLFPELELEPSNLFTLCEPHHLLFGHFMLWASWNPSVLRDAETWRYMIQNRPKNKGDAMSMPFGSYTGRGKLTTLTTGPNAQVVFRDEQNQDYFVQFASSEIAAKAEPLINTGQTVYVAGDKARNPQRYLEVITVKDLAQV